MVGEKEQLLEEVKSSSINTLTAKGKGNGYNSLKVEVQGGCTLTRPCVDLHHSRSFLSPGVLLASRRCDRQQLEVGVPALQRSLTMASQGLAKCSSVQQTLHEW